MNLNLGSLNFAQNMETEFYFSLSGIPIILSPLQNKGVILEFGTNTSATSWNNPLFSNHNSTKNGEVQ